MDRHTRTLLALLMSFLVLLPSSAAAWPPDVKSAERFASRREGSVSFAVLGPRGGRFGHRAFTEVPAASVIKVMFMVAYLRQGSVRSRELRSSDKELLRPMIRRSDNDAATRIANMLGPRPINRLARRVGMTHFEYTRPWGLSTITAKEQARFMYEIERYIPNRHERYARFLLSHVVSSQRWGIGQIRRPNWKFFFKGGWGSGTGAVCHQVAFLERAGMRIAAAVMITDRPSHAYATATLKGVFRRLLRGLPRP